MPSDGDPATIARTTSLGTTMTSDQDLGEMDTEEDDFSFPPAERKVVTQPVDLSVSTLADQWKDNILILPEIQREYVWDRGKASRLIESLLLNIPIPVLYFAETEQARYEIFDGHQRIKSIIDYLNGLFALSGLAVLREYKGKRFSQLPEREQRFVKMRTLRTVVISIDSHPNMKFEIYECLNTGSISLNAQELRNSIYRGPFNEMLHVLARLPTYRQLIGTKVPRKRMVDEEAILRFFVFRDRIGSYKTPLKKFLNDYFSTMKGVASEQIAEYSAIFDTAVSRASHLLGLSAFRLLDPDGFPSEASVNRSLLVAQLLACSWIADDSAPDPAGVRTSIAALFGNDTFNDSIQRATGDRARTLQRVRDTVTALRQAGAQVDVPHNLQA